jgi:hypothetical protein
VRVTARSLKLDPIDLVGELRAPRAAKQPPRLGIEADCSTRDGDSAPMNRDRRGHYGALGNR